MFKKASQLGLRFSTSRGPLSVEQLWSLSMTAVSTIVRGLKKQLNNESDDELDFLDEVSKTDPLIQLRFDIAKDIYLTKRKKLDDKKNAAAAKLNNQKILELISKKQNSKLEELSVEELEKLLT